MSANCVRQTLETLVALRRGLKPGMKLDPDAVQAAWAEAELALAEPAAPAAVDIVQPARLAEVRHGIYTASKTKHAPKWQALRAAGFPIISTWIDEWQADASKDLPDLWVRCIRESASCAMLLLYVEEGDVLKGAHAEAGVALSHGIPVHYVGPRGLFSMLNHPLIRHFDTLEAALATTIDEVDGYHG